jgi:alginate O-acetyltransferase complex protein AlgJ
MRTSKVNRITDLTMVGILALVTVLPLIDTFVDLDGFPRNDPERESMRARSGVIARAGALKWWFSNHFGFRDLLMRLHAHFKRDLLGVSPSPRVLLGRNGWLFLRDERALDDHRNLYPFREDELARWTGLVERRAAVSASVGATYLFGVAPEKATAYPDLLPEDAGSPSGLTRYDALFAELARKGDAAKLVDMRRAVLDGRKTTPHPLYFATDTHWNELGALFGYRELRRTLATVAPGLDPRWPELQGVDVSDRHGGDLARLIGMKWATRERSPKPRFVARPVTLESGAPLVLEMLDGPSFQRLVTVCPEAELEAAVVFHDSFGKVLTPLLAQTFRRVVFVWDNEFDPGVVRREKPTVVIQEITERRLLGWEPPDFELGAAERSDGSTRVVYRSAGGRELRLWLYPASPTHAGPAPGVLLFHGGAFRRGSPRELRALAEALSRAGHVVALAEYRLLDGSGVTIDDSLADASAALEWFGAHATELGVDPLALAVGGVSAGAHLAFWTAERAPESRRPAALVLLSGVLDTAAAGPFHDALGDRAAALSPLAHVSARLPPTLVLHGLSDDVVPVGAARAFAAALGRASVPHELDASEGSHAVSFDPKSAARVVGFLRARLARPAR